MYLSRLILNPRNRYVQTDLANPYQLHRTVMSGLPQGKVQVDRSANGAAGVLYRLDSDERRGLLTLLVQSQTQPDWAILPTGYILPPDPYDLASENPAIKPFEPQFQPRQMLNFRLLANPTKRLGKRYGTGKGKRVGLYKTDEQMAWLQRKAQQSGFRLVSARPSHDRMQSGTIRREQTTHSLKLHTVRFDGVLQVVDPDQFYRTLQEGIGSAKAFGCGLLSLARMQ